MAGKKASLGSSVVVRVDPRTNNGSDEAVGVVTRVWEHDKVNVRVLLDGEETLWLTSVKLFTSKSALEKDDSGDTARGAYLV